LLKFEEDFKDSTLIKLEQNYRSTSTIIEAANEIIKHNKVRKDKHLFTENEKGEAIEVMETDNDKLEANYVAETISALVQSGVSGGDIAILYRNNFQSRVLEQALLAKEVPYHLLGVRFFDRKEVRDVLSYLRLSENRDSVEDLKRALSFPSKGFGKVALTKILTGQIGELTKTQQEKLSQFWSLIESITAAKEDHTLSELLHKIIIDSGIEATLKAVPNEEEIERLANTYELVELAREYDELDINTALERFLEESSLVSDQDTDTDETSKVRLMTIHASKGLEFHNVFIVGLENGLFPSDKKSFSQVSKEEAEEERRLFYVALTRARTKLYLTYARERMLWGKKQYQTRSEFIDDIPSELLQEEIKTTGYDADSPFERIIRYL
jgi:DNA helicase-2/ATP-dependent DNA helicase PcrA